MTAWIMAIIALGGILVNTITLYNDVKHLKKDVDEIKQELRDLHNILMEKEK